MGGFKRSKGLLLLLLGILLLLGRPQQAEADQGGWIQSGGRWWYQEADGGYPAASWQQIGGSWYYFDQGGWMTTGWQKVKGIWYYMEGSGRMLTGWQQIGEKWYYLNSSGSMAADTWVGEYYVNSSGAWEPGKQKASAGWVKSGARWWYREANGSYPAAAWKLVNGSWYYFDQGGWMTTGWQMVKGTWYYMEGSGRMLTGWQQIGGSWYYLNNSGSMASDTWIGEYYVNSSGAWEPERQKISAGWVQSGGRWWYREADGSYPASAWKLVNGSWYYFDQGGWMTTGWQKVKGTWYYMEGSGRMLTGWQQIGGSWYFLNSSGSMASDTWIGEYYVNSSGAWEPGLQKVSAGWVESGGRWWYQEADGSYPASSWKLINGSWYYFDRAGWMTTGWQMVGSSWYYMDSDGRMLTGWQQIGGSWYYLNDNGSMAADTWIGEYYVNSKGVWESDKNRPQEQTGSITDCKISGNQVSVTAAMTSQRQSDDNNYYLFAVGSDDTAIPAGAVPLASIPKGNSLTMQAPLNKDTPSSLLQSKFVVAVKQGAGYTITTNGRYITNPEAVAEYSHAFPTASSKKGLQVNTAMMDDAANLGVKHAVINIVLSELLKPGNTPYNYDGTTYYLNDIYINQLDEEMEGFHSRGMITTAVMLVKWYEGQQDLILPSGRTKGYNIYGWNTVETAGRKKLEAACTYLAKRYTPKGLVNWVASNEIAMPQDYHYCGNVSFDQYMKYCTDEYRLLHNAVKSVYSNARAYISLDHVWTYNGRANCYSSKSVLDRFAALLSQEGNLDWNLAFHPYPFPETDSAFWKGNSMVTDSWETPIITMKNLRSLTDYIRNTYGSGRRIILSESGFSSSYNGVKCEENQAAAIAYGFYLAEADDMVDSFVVHRHVDHAVEISMGFSLGLWTNQPGMLETAAKKKMAYDVFKYMDTSQYMAYTQFALPMIGKTSWEQAVPGFNGKKYS